MLNNEQSNVEELLKQKEDKKYKKTEISSQSQTGDSDICYPTVGAVRDFVNYIKTDLEDYYDNELNKMITEEDLEKKENISKRTSRISDSTTINYDKTHYPDVYAIKTAGFKKNFYDKKEILHQSGPQDVITGTYRLADDLCTVVGKVKIKAGESSMRYTLPTPVIFNTASIAVNNGKYYIISTDNSENIPSLCVADMNNDNITEDATLQFIITYKYI